MGDFPVAAGCWTEMVVRRESGDLGSKNSNSVEEEDGQGRAAGWREGRSRVEAHGTQMVAPTLSVESTFGGAGQQNQISPGYVPSKSLGRQTQSCAVYTQRVPLGRRVAGTCSCSQSER